MGMRQRLVWLVVALSAQSLMGDEILVGVELIPQRTMALLLTPVVVFDPVSVKMAFEYRLHSKLNLVVPLEAKWMNYRTAIKYFNKGMDKSQNYPEDWYKPNKQVKPGWNFDYAHKKIATGLGLKVFPFSESMTNAFFIKTALLAGAERMNAFAAEGIRDGWVFTHVLSVGYNWVAANAFTFGFEIGEEYDYHTNPINKMPRLLWGFSPLFQLSLGFTM